MTGTTCYPPEAVQVPVSNDNHSLNDSLISSDSDDSVSGNARGVVTRKLLKGKVQAGIQKRAMSCRVITWQFIWKNKVV